MILTQKQSHFNMPVPNAAALHHRRHPSAPPAVVVQPTRTPGLLSLQKPHRQSPVRMQQQQHRQSQQRSSPKGKSLQPTAPTTTATTADKHVEHEANKQSPMPSKEKDHRGRQQAKHPREKAAKRSASHSSHETGRARGGNNRQSSPPLPLSQAEVPSTPPADQSFASNPFDPFLDSSDSDSASNTRASPTKGRPAPIPPALSAKPSGKLAKRRNNAAASPSPTKAIAVPRQPAKVHDHALSRSDPVQSSMPQRPMAKRPAAVKRSSTNSMVSFPTFPVCDDTEDDMRTPRPPAVSLPLDDGPRTAPLSSTGGAQFPFAPQPVPATPRRNHQRTPSDGMFAMDDGESDELRALFGLFRKAGGVETPVGNKPFYASSMFQNSPSPDDLPPPPF